MTRNFVLGAPEIELMLKSLPEKVAKRLMLNGLRVGARVVAKGMRQRAPKRTGKLAKSVTVSSAAKVTRGKAHVVVGFRKPTSRRAHLAEFGTEHSEAKPFIRPTLEEDGEQAIRQIGEIVARGLVREATRKR